jgi:hypothetical protein
VYLDSKRSKSIKSFRVSRIALHSSHFHFFIYHRIDFFLARTILVMSKEIPTIVKVDPKKGAIGQQGLQ